MGRATSLCDDLKVLYGMDELRELVADLHRRGVIENLPADLAHASRPEICALLSAALAAPLPTPSIPADYARSVWPSVRLPGSLGDAVTHGFMRKPLRASDGHAYDSETLDGIMQGDRRGVDGDVLDPEQTLSAPVLDREAAKWLFSKIGFTLEGFRAVDPAPFQELDPLIEFEIFGETKHLRSAIRQWYVDLRTRVSGKAPPRNVNHVPIAKIVKWIRKVYSDAYVHMSIELDNLDYNRRELSPRERYMALVRLADDLKVPYVGSRTDPEKRWSYSLASQWKDLRARIAPGLEPDVFIPPRLNVELYTLDLLKRVRERFADMPKPPVSDAAIKRLRDKIEADEKSATTTRQNWGFGIAIGSSVIAAVASSLIGIPINDYVGVAGGIVTGLVGYGLAARKKRAWYLRPS